MHSSLIAWIMRAIPFGTIIMYGALGETVTEKSGNLNLGVPGIMYLGGFAGFAIASYSRLLGEARRTPYTAIRGDADQWRIGLGLGYTF